MKNNGFGFKITPLDFRRGSIGVLLGFCLVLTACGGGGSKNQGTTGSNKVNITPNKVNFTVGALPFQFSAEQVLSSGEVLKEAVFTWRSEDPSILIIDSNGLARGIKVGIAQVTATSGTSTGIPMTASATVGVVSPNQGSANISLSGNVSYEDKVFNQNGFTGTIDKKPVRNAVLELVAIDGFKPIGNGSATDENGNYTITANNSAQRGGIYLRVISKTEPASNTKITVQSNPFDKALLAFRSSSMDDSLSQSQPFNPPTDILVTIFSGIGGAFNILDALSLASEFVQNSSPCLAPMTDCIPPLLTAYWAPGNSVGTFFDSDLSSISILGGGGSNGDADEYDDSVIIHEYGHFIMSHFSHDDSPGGFHFLNQNNQDIRLSWSEGWANFFSSAVRNAPFYVDTAPTAPSGVLISYDLENYSSIQSPGLNELAKFTTSEITVGGVLWDIFDGIKQSENDNLQLAFSSIFQTVMSIPPAPGPATLETFWLAFQGNSPATESVDLQTIMKARQIELSPDIPETSGEQELLIRTSQHHTLYKNDPNPQNDTDVIPFKVNTNKNYTLKTLNLSNGADTILTIKDPSGIVIENDNQNGQTFTNCSINPFNGTSNCPKNGPNDLASSVSFQWNGADGETLQAHVTRSPTAPPSAGLFGSYDIELTTSP